MMHLNEPYVRLQTGVVAVCVLYFGQVEEGSTLVVVKSLSTVKHQESKVKQRTRNLSTVHLETKS